MIVEIIYVTDICMKCFTKEFTFPIRNNSTVMIYIHNKNVFNPQSIDTLSLWLK